MNNQTRITIKEHKRHSFKKLYDFLFIEPYVSMSNDAKIMYSLLRDRFNLSVANDWINANGEIYLIYSNQDLVKVMNKSERTIIKLKKELAKYNLLEEERQGQKLPNLLFLKAENDFIITDDVDEIIEENDFVITDDIDEIIEENHDDNLELKKVSSGTEKKSVLELKNFQPNKTYINHTNINKTNN